MYSCYKILGYDIFLDSDLKAHLIGTFDLMYIYTYKTGCPTKYYALCFLVDHLSAYRMICRWSSQILNSYRTILNEEEYFECYRVFIIN